MECINLPLQRILKESWRNSPLIDTIFPTKMWENNNFLGIFSILISIHPALAAQSLNSNFAMVDSPTMVGLTKGDSHNNGKIFTIVA